MVKFSKELEAQLIPEWKDAFVNYWQLKKHVKKIKLARKPKHVPGSNCDFGRSVFDPVRFLVGRILGRTTNTGNKPDIIQVKSKISVGEEEEVQEVYETELDQLFSEENEVKVFFEMLDDELNKVNQFYKSKEGEFLERGELLNKQLQILVDLKRLLSDRRRKNLPPTLAAAAGSGFLSRSGSSLGQNSDFSARRGQSSKFRNRGSDHRCGGEEGRHKGEEGGGGDENRYSGEHAVADDSGGDVDAVGGIGDEQHKKKEEEEESMMMNRKKIECAEKMIRGRLWSSTEVYPCSKPTGIKARMCVSDSFDETEQVSDQQTSKSYLKVVRRSDFITSDKVVRIMDEVECLFTQHFANNDRKKTMMFLRPRRHKDSHMVTFFVGLFTGSFVTLFTVYAILAHVSGMFSPPTQAAYMETVNPLFSMFALLSLHLFMYGCNLFMWKSTRINYNFIFDFQPATALSYRDAFLVCTSLMTAVVGSMVLHLILLSTGIFPRQADFIPGILLLCSVLLLICPLNVFYRPTRYCFLRVIRNIVCSPFYKVLMVDFFMADQLTSQIPLFRHMESAACYFLAGSFKTHRYETCKSGKQYRELAYVISFAPYYWRAMQCARRWFDECNIDHLANLGKYVSAMVAAGARLTYARQPSQLWLVIVLVTSFVATVYQLYWDFVKDWGLLNRKSKNAWLRDDLVLKNKGIYYGSIALNFVLRVAWVETVMKFNIGMVESRLLDFFLASLEVIRRGHWNYYRLENEHLNNVGKFRAVKTVPLPFHETNSGR
ncbi:UNVERIFIED_CONTAM: Phosphate transporter [Sesamum latifolium]|uniref:Phosphate transporter n=1 Tax=Sesamum latifolium TaxID=2727402 RepID=A0AAW2VUX7_9LAMI